VTLPPEVQSILHKSIEALGGQSVIDQIRSISGLADCTSPNGPYVTELHSARHDRLLFKQIRPNRDPFTAIINGSYAWAVNPATNKVEALDARSTAMIQGHDFLMLPMILEQRFRYLQVAEANDLDGIRCNKLTAIDSLGKPCGLYFSTETTLLAGIILVNPIGRDGETVKILFTTWHKIDDILLPATMKLTDKSGDFYFTFRQLSINSLDEGIFVVPEAISNA